MQPDDRASDGGFSSRALGAGAKQSRGVARIRAQFLSFSAVGAIGFLIDAGVFFALTALLSWSILAARTLSASASIGATWAMNRATTFADSRSPRRGPELARYVVVQLGGLAVNFGVFALALWIAEPLRRTPVVALAMGSAAALAFNFVSARLLVFPSATLRRPLP
jgi:putative flippase GtrA